MNAYVLTAAVLLIPAGVGLGQLSPPTITCPGSTNSECGMATSLSAVVADTNAANLTVTWSVNGKLVQTNLVAGTTNPAGTTVSFSATLPLGTNLVGVTATDSASNSVSCFTTVTVVDTTPPVIHKVTANPAALWPPNHKLVAVQVGADVSDSCGPVKWKILGVTSNQAADAKGSGHTAPDWKITGDHTVQLRSERSGNAGDRIYTITICATDASTNTAQATVTVTVPHDQGKHKK